MSEFRLLAVGDVVGSPGRRACSALIPRLRRDQGLDFVVVNAENAAGGSGLTPDVVAGLLDGGADCLTTGDHVYKNRAVMNVIDTEPRLVRPANLSLRAAGAGWTVLGAPRGLKVAVVNLIGRAFMGGGDNPFESAERIVPEMRRSADVVVVDMHAEASAEKIAMGRFLDGQVAALWGTHTHVMTADEQVLPGGTGYITDLGMTGGHEGVIGRKAGPVIEHLRTDMPTRWEVARGDTRLSGAIFTIDAGTGLARGVRRIQVPLDADSQDEL